eukprot:TRINITY_DN2269_c0_g1_i1.p1 TRINITY_DN2269_c0_g1~~TRINITY_DN2269_c0_g1_i1.p1  ORF type:complete len:580 (+),score=128.71 TRINITY_DN2269_c0_g1_i1:83-1741(+)
MAAADEERRREEFVRLCVEQFDRLEPPVVRGVCETLEYDPRAVRQALQRLSAEAGGHSPPAPQASPPPGPAAPRSSPKAAAASQAVPPCPPMSHDTMRSMVLLSMRQQSKSGPRDPHGRDARGGHGGRSSLQPAPRPPSAAVSWGLTLSWLHDGRSETGSVTLLPTGKVRSTWLEDHGVWWAGAKGGAVLEWDAGPVGPVPRDPCAASGHLRGAAPRGKRWLQRHSPVWYSQVEPKCDPAPCAAVTGCDGAAAAAFFQSHRGIRRAAPEHPSPASPPSAAGAGSERPPSTLARSAEPPQEQSSSGGVLGWLSGLFGGGSSGSKTPPQPPQQQQQQQGSPNSPEAQRGRGDRGQREPAADGRGDPREQRGARQGDAGRHGRAPARHGDARGLTAREKEQRAHCFDKFKEAHQREAGRGDGAAGAAEFDGLLRRHMREQPGSLQSPEVLMDVQRRRGEPQVRAHPAEAEMLLQRHLDELSPGQGQHPPARAGPVPPPQLPAFAGDTRRPEPLHGVHSFQQGRAAGGGNSPSRDPAASAADFHDVYHKFLSQEGS